MIQTTIRLALFLYIEAGDVTISKDILHLLMEMASLMEISIQILHIDVYI